jgi:hypothetical protein
MTSHSTALPTQFFSLAIVWAGLIVMITTGCSPASDEPPHLRLSRQYFEDNNAAARQGPRAQQDFFRRTQHPDFTDQTCELGDMTVDLQPALSTLRPDPGFAPGGAGPPRGEVWAVGVEVTTRRGDAVVGRQIGSQHVVVLNDRAYGFAPCPS